MMLDEAMQIANRAADVARAKRGAVVPIVRSGIVAREVCRRGGRASVAAVFERSFYLRCGDQFICVGEPAIGNGPLTLIADTAGSLRLRDLGLHAGQPAQIDDREIAIGNSVRLIIDQMSLWRPPPWPIAPPAARLVDHFARLARRAAIEAPPEGLARIVFRGDEPLASTTAFARAATTRIACFERWLSDAMRQAAAASPPHEDRLGRGLPPLPACGERSTRAARRVRGRFRTNCSWRVPLTRIASRHSRRFASAFLRRRPKAAWCLSPQAGRDDPRRESLLNDSPVLSGGGDRPSKQLCRTPASGSPEELPEPIRGLIGLGPGLTPSGDDFLVGAVALLEALGENDLHVSLKRALTVVPPTSTSALSRCFLQTAAAGHVGEKLHAAVSSVITGTIDEAIAAAHAIGHSSGWDMLAGIASALRIVARFPGSYRAALSPAHGSAPVT
jgi:hypothetical protein